MADPNHPGFASHRPPAPDDSLWPLKINDDIKIKRNPSAPDWHLPPARGVILARNDAYTYRVKKFEVGGTSNVENISVDRIVATKTTQNVAEAVRLRDECHTHGIPERGRGWCIKDKVKKGFDKQMSRLFKKIKGKTRRFLVLKGSTLFYFEDCELKVMKGKLQLIKGTCAPSGEMPEAFTVTAQNQAYRFRLPTQAAALEWVRIIQNAISNVPNVWDKSKSPRASKGKKKAAPSPSRKAAPKPRQAPKPLPTSLDVPASKSVSQTQEAPPPMPAAQKPKRESSWDLDPASTPQRSRDPIVQPSANNLPKRPARPSPRARPPPPRPAERTRDNGAAPNIVQQVPTTSSEWDSSQPTSDTERQQPHEQLQTAVEPSTRELAAPTTAAIPEKPRIQELEADEDSEDEITKWEREHMQVPTNHVDESQHIDESQHDFDQAAESHGQQQFDSSDDEAEAELLRQWQEQGSSSDSDAELEEVSPHQSVGRSDVSSLNTITQQNQRVTDESEQARRSLEQFPPPQERRQTRSRSVSVERHDEQGGVGLPDGTAQQHSPEQAPRGDAQQPFPDRTGGRRPPPKVPRSPNGSTSDDARAARSTSVERPSQPQRRYSRPSSPAEVVPQTSADTSAKPVPAQRPRRRGSVLVAAAPAPAVASSPDLADKSPTRPVRSAPMPPMQKPASSTIQASKPRRRGSVMVSPAPAPKPVSSIQQQQPQQRLNLPSRPIRSAPMPPQPRSASPRRSPPHESRSPRPKSREITPAPAQSLYPNLSSSSPQRNQVGAASSRVSSARPVSQEVVPDRRDQPAYPDIPPSRYEPSNVQAMQYRSQEPYPNRGYDEYPSSAESNPYPNRTYNEYPNAANVNPYPSQSYAYQYPAANNPPPQVPRDSMTDRPMLGSNSDRARVFAPHLAKSESTGPISLQYGASGEYVSEAQRNSWNLRQREQQRQQEYARREDEARYQRQLAQAQAEANFLQSRGRPIPPPTKSAPPLPTTRPTGTRSSSSMSGSSPPSKRAPVPPGISVVPTAPPQRTAAVNTSVPKAVRESLPPSPRRLTRESFRVDAEL